MNKIHDKIADAGSLEGQTLRRCAEEWLKRPKSTSRSWWTDAETTRLVYELEVHQIELEMQNEELQQTRARMEEVLALYTDLYESAPAGYFTLASNGKILAVNLTGARLIGIERHQLLNQRFGSLVSAEDGPAFNAFLKKTFAGENRECCEVALPRTETDPLRRTESDPLFVRIEALVSNNRQDCRAAVLDVTDRHWAEAERERLIEELQTALASVKQLSGLLPICSNCKKIRNDEGYWNKIEAYFESHSEAAFTHGICPECCRMLYPEIIGSFPATVTAGPTAAKIPLRPFRPDAT